MDYMTTAEVATLVRAPVETVRYWRYVDKGPKSFKVGRRVLYAAEDVEAWLTESKTDTSDEPASESEPEPRYIAGLRVSAPGGSLQFVWRYSDGSESAPTATQGMEVSIPDPQAADGLVRFTLHRDERDSR